MTCYVHQLFLTKRIECTQDEDGSDSEDESDETPKKVWKNSYNVFKDFHGQGGKLVSLL